MDQLLLLEHQVGGVKALLRVSLIDLMLKKNMNSTIILVEFLSIVEINLVDYMKEDKYWKDLVYLLTRLFLMHLTLTRTQYLLLQNIGMKIVVHMMTVVQGTIGLTRDIGLVKMVLMIQVPIGIIIQIIFLVWEFHYLLMGKE